MRSLKDYLARSGALDIALTIVLALAIVKLVDSLVIDIVMPLISHFAGNNRDMADYFIPVGPGAHSDMSYAEAKQVGAVIGYGQFIIALVLLHHRRGAVLPDLARPARMAPRGSGRRAG